VSGFFPDDGFFDEAGVSKGLTETAGRGGSMTFTVG
jgi:hypothetical protein